jgi:hypothetical protein
MLNLGDLDWHWEYAYESGYPKSPPPAPTNWHTAGVYSHPFYWNVPTSGNAQWIGSTSSVYNSSTIWYRYRFNLDPGVNPGDFNLSLDLNVDDNIYYVFVNGTDNLSLPPRTILPASYTSPASVLLNKGWQSGPNEIVVATYNSTLPNGLLVRGSLLCTKMVNAVPTFGGMGYLLTGFGILALAAVATVRRRRAAN